MLYVGELMVHVPRHIIGKPLALGTSEILSERLLGETAVLWRKGEDATSFVTSCNVSL